MSIKKYNFVVKEDFYKPIVIFVIAPYIIIKAFVLPYLEIESAFLGITIILFLIMYISGYFIFKPKIISIIEIRNNEIRFFTPFSNRWAPIGQYRYIADTPDPQNIMVFKQNCKKIGKIGLKSAKSEKKREFLTKIEPWLIINGKDT